MMLSEDVLLQPGKTHTKLPITLKKADFVTVQLLARLRKSNSFSFGQSDSQEVPGWSGFNAAVTSQVLPQQYAIGYLPVIAAAPTDLSTVYVIFQRSMTVAHKLQQENVLITLDQAIYLRHRKQFVNITMNSKTSLCEWVVFILLVHSQLLLGSDLQILA